MKRFFILIASILGCVAANAQLTIYANLNQQGTSATCVARTVHVNTSIPGGLNNAIKSITLNQGFQAVLAENSDGSGESFCYVANVSNLTVNLAIQLQNKVSFIRVLPLPTTVVKKKGAGAGSNGERDSLNVSWWYDWGRDDVSTTTQSYVPMMWGAYSTFETTLNTIISKTNVTHLLAFNEPDAAGQGGGSLITTNPLNAVPYYKKLLRSGMRMGSPATTEGQYNNWLSDFRAEATAQNLRVDYVAVHWYDWGNVCGNFTGCDLTMPIAGRTVSMDANAIFNRFKTHINNVYALHQKPIWITEFHAHDIRPDAVHLAFMRLALPWLDANPNVERYSYFFGDDVPTRTIPGPTGILTPAAQFYSDHVSVNAYTENIYDTRPAVADVALAEWNPSTLVQGGRDVTDFAPTFLNANITAPSGLTRGSGVVVPTTASSNGYWGANDCSTTTAAAGVTANKFLTFSLKANTGKAVSYSSIEKFNIRISSNGPIKYQIDYQIDNGTFSPCATVTGPTRTTANFMLGPIDLSTISDLQNVPSNKTVTFRITPFDASTTTGSFLIGSGTADTDADLSIMGSFTDNIIVPVTLSDFQSKKVKNTVVLTWETQSAVNFSHFILERSTDGKTFYDLTKINGANTSNGSKYDYTDNTPDATATNYYRLKMVDLDGSFAYSKVLSESFDGGNTPFMVYPSITKGDRIETTFKKVSAAAQIKVFNIMGQLVNTYNLEAGTSTKSIEIAHFTEGAYFLVLQDNGTVQSRKFIKQ